MKDLFIPYDLAVLAKEKGFNEQCLGVYLNDKEFYLHNEVTPRTLGTTKYTICSAPIYAQVIDWLRIKKNILVETYPFTVSSGDSIGFRYKWSVLELTAPSLDVKNEIEDETLLGSLYDKECYNIALHKALNLI